MINENNLNFIKQSLDFWDKISEKERKLIINNTAPVFYKQNENIYSATNECIGVLIIKSGELRTYILSEDGKEITLYRLNEGDVCILSASCLLKNITFMYKFLMLNFLCKYFLIINRFHILLFITKVFYCIISEIF